MAQETDKVAILEKLIKDWRAGKFGNDLKQFLAALATQLGLTEAQALAEFEGIKEFLPGVDSLVAELQTGGDDKRDESPPPLPDIVRELRRKSLFPGQATDELARQEILPFQSESTQSRRLRASSFGNLTPIGNDAVDAILNRFFAQRSITDSGFARPPVEESFQTFRGAPPTAQDLSQGLQNIRTAGFSEAFQRDFGGNPQAAFAASIQPALLGVSPGIRGDISSIARDRFANRFAENPQNFQTPQQIMDLLVGFPGFGNQVRR